MKKRYGVLLLIFMIAISLIGCSGNKTKIPATTQNQQEPVSQETDASKSQDKSEEDEEKVDISEEQVKAAIEKITESLDSYLFTIIYLEYDNMYRDDLEEVEVSLSSREETRAAALNQDMEVANSYYMIQNENGSYSVVDGDEDGGDILVEEISKEELDRECFNLFGKQADVGSLLVFSSDSTFTDVLRMKESDDFASRIYSLYEDEGALEILDTRIEILDSDTALCELDAYCGYWGYARFEKSNYRITFELKKEDASSYGFIINFLKYQRTDNEDNWVGLEDEETAQEINQNISQSGFWGVFCYASKEIGVAQDKVSELKDQGLEAEIVVTSEWSDLNAETWYAVCSGRYDSEEEAYDQLEKVMKAGYSSAYVRYTGHPVE